MFSSLRHRNARLFFIGLLVSNVGTFGIRAAFGPLVPFSRVPLIVLVGAVEDRVVPENGKPVIRPMLTLCVTLDHRFMDGYHGGAMAKTTRDFLENPEQYDGSLARADAASVLTSSL